MSEDTKLNGNEAAILGKIRKLLKLAGNNPSPEEAAAAAAKAQELIERYKLESVNLDADGESEARRAEEVEGYYAHEPIETAKRYAAWRGSLAGTLSRAHNCKLILVTVRGRYGMSGSCAFRLIGTKTNVQIVGYLYGYLSREIERLTVEAMKGPGRGQGKTWANNFRLGAVDGIAEQIRKQREAIKREYSATAQGTQALAVVNREAIALQTYLTRPGAERFGNRSASWNTGYNPGAREAGQAAGRGIALNKGLGAGSGGDAPKRLGS